MEDKDLLKQLESLKEIKPSEDRVFSARQDLINHIDAYIEAHQTSPTFGTYFVHNWEIIKDNVSDFMLHISRASVWASAGTMAVVLGLIGGVFMSQDSAPGSLLYPVKIASEDVQELVAKDKIAYSAERTAKRIEEAQRLAQTNLSEDDAAVVSERLESYKEEVESSKTREDKEVVESEIAKVQEEVTALTSIISGSKEGSINLDRIIEENLAACTDETLLAVANDLLEEENKFEALRVLWACQDAEPIPGPMPNPDADGGGDSDGSIDIGEGGGVAEGGSGSGETVDGYEPLE